MLSNPGRSREEVNEQYKKTVLKVLDCFRVEKDTCTKEMINTKREVFKVT